ncbi:MAG: hypothetical protein QOC96_1905 [Acidobacteriota bacterium]|jgi:hypothetical protein|nr:hypothetical protein [Acidobacteriota bacterium]
MRIKIILLATLFLVFSSIGFASNSFTANPLDCLAANPGQPPQEAFAGNYSGEWTAKFTNESQEEHEGTWRISIASDGQIRGVETDKTSVEKGEISGFIDDEGYTKVFVKYASGRVSIKGTLELHGNRLTGTLEQTCNSSADVCANVDIILKRN